MNIQIMEQPDVNLNVIIQCRQMDSRVLRLKAHIEQFDNKLQAKKDDEYCFVNVADVFYFESVDNRTFLYTADSVLEVKQRLYELENILSDKDFIRISKSLIININKVEALRPELNRTIQVTMIGGERLHISRKYVPAVRKLLSV